MIYLNPHWQAHIGSATVGETRILAQPPNPYIDGFYGCQKIVYQKPKQITTIFSHQPNFSVNLCYYPTHFEEKVHKVYPTSISNQEIVTTPEETPYSGGKAMHFSYFFLEEYAKIT